MTPISWQTRLGFNIKCKGEMYVCPPCEYVGVVMPPTGPAKTGTDSFLGYSTLPLEHENISQLYPLATTYIGRCASVWQKPARAPEQQRRRGLSPGEALLVRCKGRSTTSRNTAPLRRELGFGLLDFFKTQELKNKVITKKCVVNSVVSLVLGHLNSAWARAFEVSLFSYRNRMTTAWK